MYTLYSQSEGHGARAECEQKCPDLLTLQDLLIPDVLPSQSGCVCEERPLSGTTERRAVAGSFSPPFSSPRVRDKIVCVFIGETFRQPVSYTVQVSPCLMLCIVIGACVKEILLPSFTNIVNRWITFLHSLKPPESIHIGSNKFDILHSVLKDVNVVCTAICVFKGKGNEM